MPIPPFPVLHALAPADQTAMTAMRVASALMKGKIDGPTARQPFEELMQQTPAGEGVTYQAATVGGVPGWWCQPADNRMPLSTVLYLHGGAYVLGSASAHRHFVSQLVTRTGVEFFVADYRLGPEHPFPAAVEDALAAYQGLVALGKHRVAICGDSAGGGLALVTVALATHEAAGQPGALAPHAALVFSPWTDLALTSPSMTTRAEADPLLTKESLAACARYYLQGHEAHDPRASPVYGNLMGLPPVHIHVGDAEILLDDSVRYVDQARAAGVAAEVHVWEGLPHVFASNVAGFIAAGQALDMGAAFLVGQLA